MSCCTAKAPGAVNLTLSVSGHDVKLAFKGSQSFATFPAASTPSFSSMKASLLAQTTGTKSSPATTDLARASVWVQIDESCDLVGLMKLLSVDLLNLSLSTDGPSSSEPSETTLHNGSTTTTTTTRASPVGTATTTDSLPSLPKSLPVEAVRPKAATTPSDSKTLKAKAAVQDLPSSTGPVLSTTTTESFLSHPSLTAIVDPLQFGSTRTTSDTASSCSVSVLMSTERAPLNGHRRALLPGVDDVKKSQLQVPLPREAVPNVLGADEFNPNKHQLQVLRWMWERYGCGGSDGGRAEGPTVYEMIPQQDGTLREFYNDFIAMKERRWITELDGSAGLFRLSQKVQPLVDALGSSLSSLPCLHCSAQGWLGDKNPRLQEQFLEILKNRPAPSKDYDQQFIVPQNVLHRAAFMNARGDLAKRKVLIIGDDDLFSIVLGLSGLAEEVVVLDVDTRVVDFVNHCSEEYGLRIKAYPFDIRFPFPQEFYRRFDTFNCDPVETLEGIKLFLSAGAAGLKGPGSAIYFGLTTMEAGLQKWHAIENCVLKMNFTVTDINRKFNEYETTDFDDGFTIQQKLGPNIKKFNWYRSSLLRLESFDVPQPCTDVDVTRPNLCEIYIDSETWAT